MAGEIQLNSTTMATESSGSITAELDTIRPNTTNGSLTLQGDSSNAGVTGLTIDSSGNATFAQTISGGTLGSSVVFPAGHIINIWSATRATQYDHTAGATWTTVSDLSIPITIGSGNKVLIMASLQISASLFDGRRALYRIVRNTPSDPTEIAVSTDKTYNGSGGTMSNSASNGGPFATVFLDTPSATSVTYSVQLANFDGVTTYLNRFIANAGAFSSFTLLEIQQ